MRTIQKLCAAMLALLLMSLPAQAASLAVLTNAAAPAYRTASVNAEMVIVPKGLEMALVGYEKGWGKVSRNGKTAYVPIRYLDLKKPVKACLLQSATFYTGAGTGVIGTLSRGTEVSVRGIDGSYARITNGQGYSGYVPLSALKTKKSTTSLLATEASARRSRIERVIYTAQNLMGVPYALLADPPASFNCASFVYYCFNKAQSGVIGKRLNDQVNDSRYRKISTIDDLKRGDLVCFNFTSDSDPFGHVGIYIGEGWFVHASSSEKKVTVDKLTSGYYERSFSWGRRIFGE